MSRFFLTLFVCILMQRCNQQNSNKAETKNDNGVSVNIKYAKRFKINKTASYTTLQLLGDKNSDKVTSTFVLYSKIAPKLNPHFYYIKVPVKSIASMSSIYTAMLQQLNCLNNITAIDNVDYYNSQQIISKVNSNSITQLSKGSTVDVEKTLALNPDLFLTFGMGNLKEDVDTKLINANIPCAIVLDHLEETPLARAEWIKFIACFVNKEQLADSIFNAVEKKYNDLKQIALKQTDKPTVLTEIKYGDAWYVPGGNSCMANLITDAGGTYFWKQELQTGSIPLSFEIVYTKAKQCDVWINLYNANSKKELLAYDERYSLFNAFTKNKLYNNNKTQNNKGFSNYWELGISNPHLVLNDLMAILHPQLFKNYTFNYYKQLN